MSGSVLHKLVASDGTVINVHVHERRRYGNSATYTWVYAEAKGFLIEGVFDSPFPCVMPSKAACIFALRSVGFDIPVGASEKAWLNKKVASAFLIDVSPEDYKSLVSPASKAKREAALLEFKESLKVA